VIAECAFTVILNQTLTPFPEFRPKWKAKSVTAVKTITSFSPQARRARVHLLLRLTREFSHFSQVVPWRLQNCRFHT
jgi:hypothetical protein